MREKTRFAFFCAAFPGLCLLLAWGCQPGPSFISLSPARIVAGVGNVTLHVTGSRFESGMSVRVGGRVLAASLVSDREMTCSLPRDLLLLSGAAATSESLSVCVLDAQGRDFSVNAFLTLESQFSWEPAASPPALDTVRGGPCLFALSGQTLLLVGRNAANEIWGAVSGDSGSTWGTPRRLFAGAETDGPVRFVAHPQTGVSAVIDTPAGILFHPLLRPDGGDAAGSEVLVAPATEASLIDLSIICDGRNHLHMAWLATPNSQFNERYTIHYSCSTDGGSTWTGPRLVQESINTQPGRSTLFYAHVRLDGAEGDGRIFMDSDGSSDYRFFREGLLSRDGGQTWTAQNGSITAETGAVVTSRGSLLLGGYFASTPYYPRQDTAVLLSSPAWESDWQEIRFQGSDWNPVLPSRLLCLRGDSWGNLLLACTYNQIGTSTMAQTFFRSADSGATWSPAAAWPAAYSSLSTLADLALDSAGSAFALFKGGDVLSLYRARACPGS